MGYRATWSFRNGTGAQTHQVFQQLRRLAREEKTQVNKNNNYRYYHHYGARPVQQPSGKHTVYHWEAEEREIVLGHLSKWTRRESMLRSHLNCRRQNATHVYSYSVIHQLISLAVLVSAKQNKA